MVVGGKDSFIGPILGTGIIMLISEFARSLDEYRPLLIGAITILVGLFMPEGIVGLPSRIKMLIGNYKKPAVHD